MSGRLALAAALTLNMSAQGAATGEARTVSGRVVRATAGGVVSVSGVWVVLHRVGSDTAHPLDSMRTRADGSYHFGYRASGSPDAVYFLAATWSGIAYFTSPLTAARVSGSDAELTVYDTTSRGSALKERGHHVIVFAPRADGLRDVMEIFELSNDGLFTMVSAGSGQPTWSARVPAGARDVRPGQSEISSATMIPTGGGVEIYAPIAPGVKQLSFSYRLPPSALPLTIRSATDSAVLEVLLEEPGATVTGGGLRPTENVMLDAHRLARWLSPAASAGSPVRVAIAPRPLSMMTYAIGALTVLMTGSMVAALLLFMKRRA